MFLVTSSYKHSWPDSEKIIFAGEWCKAYDDFDSYKDLNHTTMKHHWSDRKTLHNDLKILESVYEKYLNIISKELNKIHEVNKSTRYWRMIVGPWLQDFIELIFDYYQVILQIDKADIVDDTLVVETQWQDQIPQDISTFQELYSKDWYTHFLFSEIIKVSSNIPYTLITRRHPLITNLIKDTEKQSFLNKFKRLTKYVFSYIYSSRIVTQRKKNIVFVASYFKDKDLYNIQRSLNQLPFKFLFDPKPKRKRCNDKIRSRINLSDGQNNFEKLLDFIIPRQIPVAYIENYKSYNKITNLFFPKKPSIIFTANSYYFNESFKMWSASCIENGSKLFVSQHGGFGTALWNQTEAHQISICDIFYSWGWSRVDNLKVRPMPANKLNNIKKKITSSKNGKVLCVVNSDIVNYLHVQIPQAFNLDFKKYVSDLIKIVKNLDSDLGNIFKYRLYHTNYNRGVYGIKTEFERNNLYDYIDDKNDFYSSLCDSRLAIITYHPNATALETLAANFPTLLFWNPEVFEINQTSMPFFIELEKVGVFHTTIESLTGHLKDVYMDIDTWWFSTSVQRAVKMFCTEFALTSDNFVEAWTSELEAHL